MFKKGQIIRIKSYFKDVQLCYPRPLCNRNHIKRNLFGEVVEINQTDDGFYNILILLNNCKDLHNIEVLPEEVELDIIKTLKHLKNAN